jgi:hypothetical protein
MDNSGEAAERVVRIGLDGAWYAAKITGASAKYLAALLVQTAKEENKTSGAMKLKNLLKQNKELKVYTLTEPQFEKFRDEVKRFGVTYCVLRDTDESQNHPVEIMVKADDAAKIQRIFERLEFANVDTSELESTVEESIRNAQNVPEREESADIGDPANGATMKKEAGESEHPFLPQESKSAPSEPTSEKRGSEGKARQTDGGKKSVRKEIAEMREERGETYGGKERERTERKPLLPIDMRNPGKNVPDIDKEAR